MLVISFLRYSLLNFFDFPIYTSSQWFQENSTHENSTHENFIHENSTHENSTHENST